MTDDAKKSCTVARPIGRNYATFTRSSATGAATAVQPTRLKALALKVLERNRQCNHSATNQKTDCNFSPPKRPKKLHCFDHEKTPCTGTDNTIISAPAGPLSETKLPAWCSGSCPHLEALESPQGRLAVCRQELDDQIRWVRLSFLENCPMKKRSPFEGDFFQNPPPYEKMRSWRTNNISQSCRHCLSTSAIKTRLWDCISLSNLPSESVVSA